MAGNSLREVPAGLGTTQGFFPKVPEAKINAKNPILYFSIQNLKSLLPGQAEFEFRTPRVQYRQKMMIFLQGRRHARSALDKEVYARPPNLT